MSAPTTTSASRAKISTGPMFIPSTGGVVADNACPQSPGFLLFGLFRCLAAYRIKCMPNILGRGHRGELAASPPWQSGFPNQKLSA